MIWQAYYCPACTDAYGRLRITRPRLPHGVGHLAGGAVASIAAESRCEGRKSLGSGVLKQMDAMIQNGLERDRVNAAPWTNLTTSQTKWRPSTRGDFRQKQPIPQSLKSRVITGFLKFVTQSYYSALEICDRWRCYRRSDYETRLKTSYPQCLISSEGSR